MASVGSIGSPHCRQRCQRWDLDLPWRPQPLARTGTGCKRITRPSQARQSKSTRLNLGKTGVSGGFGMTWAAVPTDTHKNVASCVLDRPGRDTLEMTNVCAGPPITRSQLAASKPYYSSSQTCSSCPAHSTAEQLSQPPNDTWALGSSVAPPKPPPPIQSTDTRSPFF